MSRASLCSSRLLPLTLLTLLAACQTSSSPLVEGARELAHRGDGQFSGHRWQEALDSYKLAAMAADQEGDDEVFVHATAGCALTLALSGRATEAESWLQQTQDRLREDDEVGRCRAELAQGALLIQKGERLEGIQHLDLAHAGAMSCGQYGLAMQAANLAASQTQGDAQLLYGRRVMEAAQASGDRAWIAAALDSLGWIHDAQGNVDLAVEAFREARRRAPQGDVLVSARASWALARALRMAGELEEAQSLVARARAELARDTGPLVSPGSQEWQGRLAYEEGALSAARGDLRQALQHYRFAERKFVSSGAADVAPELVQDVRTRIAEVRWSLDRGR